METTRLDAWVDGLEPIPIFDEASISLAREHVRKVGTGLPTDVVESLATVASELTRNQLVHASGGRFVAQRVERGGVTGLELIAADRGPGLEHPTRALQGDGSTSGGLGSGLAGTRRLTDELDFDIRLGEGTCIRARKFVGLVPYRTEIAALGRPCVGESVSGDDAAFVREAEALVLGVVDGLGHGSAAHEAGATAIATLREWARESPEKILLECNGALAETRGAVMAVARIDRSLQEVVHVCVGDVSTHLYRPREAHRFSCPAGFLGQMEPRGRISRLERVPFRPDDLLVMFSDGLSTRFDLSDDPLFLREHPVVIAERLMEEHGRANDDALVLVAK